MHVYVEMQIYSAVCNLYSLDVCGYKRSARKGLRDHLFRLLIIHLVLKADELESYYFISTYKGWTGKFE